MTLRAKVAALVDMTLGCILLAMSLTHTHLTVRRNGGGAVVPSYWLYAVILLIMGIVTGWSLYGWRRK